MFKVNLENELDSRKRESQTGNQIVDSAKLLLEGDHAKEIDLLKKLGLAHQVIKAENHRGLNIERSQIENKYQGKAFTGEEIKGICMDYNLRFLQSKRFKGSIDLELGVKIRNFFEKHKLCDGNYGDTENFYIMAPTKAFNLDDRPKPVEIDPVLFYQPDRNNDKYLLVHKWGNEFTIFRLISGLLNRRMAVHMMFMWGFFIGIVNAFYALWGNYSPVIDFVFSFLFGTIILLIYFLIRTDGGDTSGVTKFERKFSDECWDSIYND